MYRKKVDHVFKLGCPSWSKGYDLRSYGESLVGSNPTPSNMLP